MCLHSCCTRTALELHSRCTRVCTHTALVLHSHCTRAALVLHSSCTRAALTLHLPCTHTAFSLHLCCTRAALVLQSFCNLAGLKCRPLGSVHGLGPMTIDELAIFDSSFVEKNPNTLRISSGTTSSVEQKLSALNKKLLLSTYFVSKFCNPLQSYSNKL